MAAGSSGSALRALVALLLLCVAAAGRDFYNILGVDRGADEATIKKNYRNLAKKWHPDKNPGEEEKAEAKFREVCDGTIVASLPWLPDSQSLLSPLQGVCRV